MKIHVNNHYGKLRSCMVGGVDDRVLDTVESHKRKKLEHIFEKTHRQLDGIQKKLESMGVEVFRPKCFDNSKKLSTPYFNTIGHRVPLAPSDHFFILDNNIIEIASWSRESAFTGMHWRHVMRSAFNDGANWISMPMPLHNIDEVDNFDSDIPNLDPIIDAPSFYLHNDHVFVSSTGAGNELGIAWMKRQFPNHNWILMDAEKFVGHLDSHFNILRPGLIASHRDKTDFPEYFRDWDFVKVDSVSRPSELVDTRLQDDDQENTVLSVNSLSIDSKTIMVERTYEHNHNDFIPSLIKQGIMIEYVDFDFSHFFGHGLGCICTPLYREDE